MINYVTIWTQHKQSTQFYSHMTKEKKNIQIKACKGRQGQVRAGNDR